MGGVSVHAAGHPALHDLPPLPLDDDGGAFLHGHLGHSGSAWQWIGWDNYREFFILQNIRDLKASLGRTAIYALSVTLIQNALALLMAVILNGKFLKGRNFARAVYFMP